MTASTLLIFAMVTILDYIYDDIYDGQLRGNFLIVGKTRCGKTYFMQKLAINKFFEDNVKAEWASSN